MTSVPDFIKNKIEAAARSRLDELAANGARLEPQQDQGDGLRRILVGYVAGADQVRARAIVAAAKAEPDVWCTMKRIAFEQVEAQP